MSVSVENKLAVNPSAIAGVRFLISRRIEELENSAAKQEARLLSASQRRGELREKLAAAETLCKHVLGNLSKLSPAEVEEAFTSLANARGDMAALEESFGDIGSRIADMRAEQEVLRQIQRSMDDLSAGAGTVPGKAARPASRQAFQMIEEERMRIARDVHDGPAQALANLVLQAEILERLMKKSPTLVEKELIDFKDGVRGVLDDTRRLIFDLRPMTLDDLGLVPTLRKFLKDYEAQNHITTHLRVVGEEVRLPDTYEPTIFRIIQEALNNVWKHARADVVEVIITFEKERVTAIVKDNGTGFDISAAESRSDGPRSLGLTSMRERAELEKGSISIRSQVGVGTEVKVVFELEG